MSKNSRHPRYRMKGSGHHTTTPVDNPPRSRTGKTCDIQWILAPFPGTGIKYYYHPASQSFMHITQLSWANIGANYDSLSIHT